MGNYIKILTFILKILCCRYIIVDVNLVNDMHVKSYVNITSLKEKLESSCKIDFLRNGFMTFMLAEILLLLTHCFFFFLVKNESFSFGNDSEFFCKNHLWG